MKNKQKVIDFWKRYQPTIFKMFTIQNEKHHNLFPKNVTNEGVPVSVMFKLCSHIKQFRNVLLNLNRAAYPWSSEYLGGW